MLNGDHARDRDWLEAAKSEDDVVFVLATGNAATRATFTPELARRLPAAYLPADAVDCALSHLPADERRRAVALVVAELADAQLRARISVVIDATLDLELEAELNRVRRDHAETPVVRVHALEGQSLVADRLVGEVIQRAHRQRG